MDIADDRDPLNPTGFDPDFNTPASWALMYRAAGLQVVPSLSPGEDEHWKRPATKWADLQDALVPDLTFERWYGTKGEHRNRSNMGILTGRCSGNIFVIDLDTHTHPEAAAWWQRLIEEYTGGVGIVTVCQKTGGGGIQLLFRAPAGWLAPTKITSLGVDIRGQGGFAVMPPSKHDKGEYAWLPGNAPWECVVADAPDWLLKEVLEVVAAYGGASVKGRPAGDRGEAPSGVYNEWGRQTDFREDKMFRMVFAVAVKWQRENPIKAPLAAQRAKSDEEYKVYEAGVEPTIIDPTKTKSELLDMEGRGPSEWWDKFQRCMAQWDTKIREAAGNPPPDPDLAAEFAQQSKRAEDTAKATGKTFELFDVAQIKAWPPPKWIIEGIVIEQSLGFLYGPPGSLKSFIALDLALSLATGQGQWWERKIEGGGAVVYISVEGNAALPSRIMAWEQHRSTVADKAPFYLIKQSINFLKADDVGILLATVEAAVARAGGPVVAIFVDTVSRVLPGAKENLQEDMTVFVNACTAVRERYGSVVIGIHHTNAQGGFRGSTVVPAAGDFIIEVRREPGAMAGSIYAKKIKDGEDGWEQPFEVTKVTLGDIKGTTSLAVDRAAFIKRGGTLNWPDRDVCLQILAAIHEQWVKGKPWCWSTNTSRSAVTNIMKRWQLERELVKDMLETWTAKGVIEEADRDPKNHVVGYQKLLDL